MGPAVLGASGLHDLALCAAVEDAHLLAGPSAEREEALRLGVVATRSPKKPAGMHPSRIGRFVLARIIQLGGTQIQLSEPALFALALCTCAS